jgi:hypothetical protein
MHFLLTFNMHDFYLIIILSYFIQYFFGAFQIFINKNNFTIILLFLYRYFLNRILFLDWFYLRLSTLFLGDMILILKNFWNQNHFLWFLFAVLACIFTLNFSFCVKFFVNLVAYLQGFQLAVIFLVVQILWKFFLNWFFEFSYIWTSRFI